ncbi:hypothetical protein [Azohydromonas aeria]|uniref:hypothetical protein n=1 Tax=Azohydromonas aeria TaxID=2590212 RepID=UPI0012FCBEDD|nr:hypothetical protein [Azohydromonas aeria]
MNVDPLLLDSLRAANARHGGYVHTKATSAQLRATVRFALQMLSATRCNAAAMRRAAQRSYLHDNGFFKIVLGAMEPAVAEVRLHVWGGPDWGDMAAHMQRPSNIHDHASDFCSLVLTGRMEESLYAGDEPRAAAGAAQSYARFACGSRGEQSSYEMRFMDTVPLWRLQTLLLERGAVHAMNAALLHRITVTHLPAVTLFLQGPRKRFGTTVYAEAAAGIQRHMPSPTLGLDELHALFEWSAAELRKQEE